jgi:hypothetical protein
MECKIEPPPLLSIVIATRNRIPYAISAIQSILEIPDPRLELVVQDNSDSRELESYICANVRDRRFRYRYTPPPFSSIDNFNAALELATGEYVCLIGDDDGVNPEIIEAAAWAKTNDLDSLTSRNIPGYLWRNTAIPPTLFGSTGGASLLIDAFSSEVFDVDAGREVSRLIRNGGVYYLSYPLPKLYHGLVRRQCLEVIREKTGAYLGGLSPDIFAVMTVSQVANRVAFVDYPLTIPGACGASTSADAQKGKHTGHLEDAPHLRHRGEYHWCELVPRVYSLETIWVDSGVAALRAMGREDLVQQLNLPKLAAYCIIANRGITGPVLRDMFRGLRIMGRNRAIGAVQFAWSLLTGPGVKFARRAWNRFLILIGRKVVHNIYGLENMVEASHALTQFLKEKGYSFSGCVRRREKEGSLEAMNTPVCE